MSELRERVNRLVDYPYHLPDKPVPAGPYISYEEFLEWVDEDTLAEWVDGAIEMSSPANEQHEAMVSLLGSVFRTYCRMFQLGRVLQNPFQMKLSGKRGSGREPDVMFVAKANLGRLEKGLLRGPAELVVEVTSPESVERNRGDKYAEYARGGVPEYWIIDPDAKQADFYRLNEQGQYQNQSLDKQGRYHSQALPGFWLKPTWLWQRPLPDEVAVLKTVCGPTCTAYMMQRLQSTEEL
jgi:Uma2 family endonuclease